MTVEEVLETTEAAEEAECEPVVRATPPAPTRRRSSLSSAGTYRSAAVDEGYRLCVAQQLDVLTRTVAAQTRQRRRPQRRVTPATARSVRSYGVYEGSGSSGGGSEGGSDGWDSCPDSFDGDSADGGEEAHSAGGASEGRDDDAAGGASERDEDDDNTLDALTEWFVDTTTAGQVSVTGLNWTSREAQAMADTFSAAGEAARQLMSPERVHGGLSARAAQGAASTAESPCSGDVSGDGVSEGECEDLNPCARCGGDSSVSLPSQSPPPPSPPKHLSPDFATLVVQRWVVDRIARNLLNVRRRELGLPPATTPVPVAVSG